MDDIAFCRWRLLRFRGVDTALWDLQMEDQSEQFVARYNAVERPRGLRSPSARTPICIWRAATKVACDVPMNAPSAISSTIAARPEIEKEQNEPS